MPLQALAVWGATILAAYWDNAHLARCRSAGIAIGATPFAPGAPLAEMVALPRDRKPFPIASPRAWPAAGEAGTGALT